MLTVVVTAEVSLSAVFTVTAPRRSLLSVVRTYAPAIEVGLLGSADDDEPNEKLACCPPNDDAGCAPNKLGGCAAGSGVPNVPCVLVPGEPNPNDAVA
jgi:hypothetical protein